MKTASAAAPISLYRQQCIEEEIANSISHGVGFIASAAITPVLIQAAIPKGTIAIIGASIFGVTMMMMYLASTLYHACPPGRWKRIFQVIDHSAIFLLIAGTYSSFALSITAQSTLGWTLLGAVWIFAICGVAFKTFGPLGVGRVSIALYIGMGWMTGLAMHPSLSNLPYKGLFWFLAGGVMYTAGVIFFIYDHKNRYNHFIWHLFTLSGTMCHVVTILVYVY